MTIVTSRWLLALLAFLTPAAFLQRTAQTLTDAKVEAAHLSSTAETVFRHYI